MRQRRQAPTAKSRRIPTKRPQLSRSFARVSISSLKNFRAFVCCARSRRRHRIKRNSIGSWKSHSIMQTKRWMRRSLARDVSGHTRKFSFVWSTESFGCLQESIVCNGFEYDEWRLNCCLKCGRHAMDHLLEVGGVVVCSRPITTDFCVVRAVSSAEKARERAAETTRCVRRTTVFICTTCARAVFVELRACFKSARFVDGRSETVEEARRYRIENRIRQSSTTCLRYF